MTSLVSFITYNLNLPLPFLNMRAQHFGSVLLTNVSNMEGFTEVLSSNLGLWTDHQLLQKLGYRRSLHS